MKLSELLKNNDYGAYILGNIFAFQYKFKNDYLSVFIGKEQVNKKGRIHSIDIKKDFNDILIRAGAFYNKNLLEKYSEVSEEKIIKSILKNSIGIFSIIKNDIKGEIDFSILDKLNINNGNFSVNFLRGVIDARSSGDLTTNYIAMDIKKKQAISFVTIMIKAFENIFGNKIQYNINPRFKQKSGLSRLKNPQFRVPYTVVFGDIGTFRKQYFRKLKENKNEYKKFQTCSSIPDFFTDLIIWDTSQITYKPRSVKNYLFIPGDVDYANNYSPQNELLLYSKLKEKYPNIYNLKKDKYNFSDELMKDILNKTNSKDFLVPKKEIEINKKGEPLIDIHHIIPRKYKHVFIEKNNVDEIFNLVPLRQDTHYLLHRGAFSEKKIIYLKELYKHIKPILNRKTIKIIDFNDFKLMY